MTCRIALFLVNDGDYQELLWDSCQEAAQRHGFPVRAFWADNDFQKQNRQIQACLDEPEDQRPTVMIVSPVREIALISSAHVAASQGIGWVLLQRWSNYMTDLRRQFPHLPIFSVMADQEAVGRIQGRQFEVLLPEGGTVIYVRGPLGTSSAMRRFAGVQEVLGERRIELVAMNSDWTVEGGARAVSEWLRSSHARTVGPFIIGAQNDAMAIGARRALEEFAGIQPAVSIAHIPVCGCDGTPGYGQQLVAEGKLASTVVMPPGGGIAVDAVASVLRGGRRPPAQVVLLPMPLPDLQLLGTRAARRVSRSRPAGRPY